MIKNTLNYKEKDESRGRKQSMTPPSRQSIDSSE